MLIKNQHLVGLVFIIFWGLLQSFPAHAGYLPPTMLVIIKTEGNGHGNMTLEPEPLETDCDFITQTCTYTYNTGSEITITAMAEADSTFVSWIDESGRNRCKTVETTETRGVIGAYLISNIRCTATFELKPFSLQLSYGGTGQGEVQIDPPGQPIDCSYDDCRSYDGTTELTLTPIAELGSQFDAWSGHPDCQDGQVILDEDKQCTASFLLGTIHSLAVTMTGRGQGQIQTQPEGPNYNKGTEVTVTVVPDAISNFVEWGGDCAGLSEPATLIMDATKNCTAQLERLVGTIKTDIQEGGGSVAVDREGNIFVVDFIRHNFYLLRANGTFITVAGTGQPGYSGDGQAANLAELNYPADIALDSHRHLYIADWGNHRIRKIDIDTGIITTVVGSGALGIENGDYQGDGGVATTARLNGPLGVAFDPADNLYIADSKNHVIRKVDSQTGIITTFAGNGTSGYDGDGALATEAQLNLPNGIALDSAGHLYIADTYNHVIRKVDATTNNIMTIAGIGGQQGYSGDGGLATAAQLFRPTGVALDQFGNLYIADTDNHVIRKVQADTGMITALAGTAQVGSYTGDIGLATAATLNRPKHLAIDNPNRMLYLADFGNNVVRSVTLDLPANFTLTTRKQGTGTGQIVAPVGFNAGIHCGSTCREVYLVDTTVTLTATPDAGSNFISWQGDCAGTEPSITLTMTAAQTCIAQFDLLPLPLNVTKIGSGTGTLTALSGLGQGINCGTICTENYTMNTQVTLTATADANAAFVGWQGDCVGSDPSIVITLDTAKTCTAQFDLLAIPLTVIKEGKGTGLVTAPAGEGTGIDCGTACTESYSPQSSVVLTATPDATALFNGWFGDCAGSDRSVTVTLDAAKTCRAHFDLLPPPNHHNLRITQTDKGTITSDLPGIQCGPECVAFYAANSTVTLTAMPNPGLIFTTWGGDCQGVTNPLPVLIDTTKTCWAHFLTLPPAHHFLIATKTGEGTITSDPSGIHCDNECVAPYPENSTVTLTAIPAALSQFVRWEGSCNGLDPVITVPIDAQKTCIAHFEPIASSVQFSLPYYSINEIEGEATLLVTRAASKVGPISVNYATINGTALAGIDYAPMTGTLNWANNDSTHKRIKIPLVNSGFSPEPKTLSVALSPISGRVALGKNGQASLTIIDTPDNGAGTLQFASPNYQINEINREAVISVERIGGHEGAVSVNYTTDNGTALINSDYIQTQGRLDWSNKDTAPKTFTIPIVTDTEVEPNEMLTLILSNPIGGTNLGANKVALLEIIDSLATPNTMNSAGRLQFVTSHYDVPEESGSVLVAVSRTEGSHGPVEVNYTLHDGTAQVGSDYLATPSTTLKWDNNDAHDKNIIIPILTDTLSEENETFTISLSNPKGNASLGPIPMTTVTLLDSMGTPDTFTPPPAPGILQFDADHYQITEDEGSLTITVSRTGGSDGVIEVTYMTENNTAKSQDYIATQGTFRWLDGESGTKSFKLDIYDDGLIEENENLLLKLSKPTGEAKLGTNAQAVLTIIDNDATWVQFSSNNYVINENETNVTITVNREGGLIGQVSVSYEISDQCPTTHCATAGSDYKAVKGLLTWLSGDSGERTVTIPIYEDDAIEGDETLQLKLFNLMGNANFGSFQETTVTIVDNDPGECQPTHIVDCYWNNQGKTLQNILITATGTVVEGQLGGQIQNEGIIQNVFFLPNTLVTGNLTRTSIVQGDISSDPEEPAILRSVRIPANTTLNHIIVGRGTVVESGVILQQGVRFESNSNIPYLADLKETLGTITSPGLEGEAIKLTHDILVNSSQNGIVDAINGLPELTHLNLALRQNLENGYLILDDDRTHYMVLPTQVQQVWGIQPRENNLLKPISILIEPNNEVTFITHTGREIKSLPVVQNPTALRQALNTLGLNQMTVLPNGNLKIPAPNGSYYYARPNLFSLDVAMNRPLGIDGVNSPWVSHLIEVFLVFEDTTNAQLDVPATQRRQQWMYPAAAVPEALSALSGTSDSETVLYHDGRVYAYSGQGEGKKVYKGVLDYLVTPGQPINSHIAHIVSTPDVNGDGFDDYLIVYPNGETQVMYYCAICFDGGF